MLNDIIICNFVVTKNEYSSYILSNAAIMRAFLTASYRVFGQIPHRSVESTWQTKNFPSISTSQLLKMDIRATYLNPEFQKNPAMDIFSRPIQRFSTIKLHATEMRLSLKEVCEGVAGAKNHIKKFCWP